MMQINRTKKSLLYMEVFTMVLFKGKRMCIVCMMCLCLLVVTYSHIIVANAETEGVTPDGLEYEIDWRDEVEIRGYRGTDTQLVIPETIDGCKVTEIGESAFSNCTELTSIYFPQSITDIWCCSFTNCSGLASICIPSSVTTIYSCTFDGCTSLSSVEISKGVTEIEKGSFNECKALTVINVSSNNTEYTSKDGVVFSKDMTKLILCPAGKSGTYEIPSSVTSIAEGAFWGCEKLTKIIIPSSVTDIERGAFKECTNLKEINVSNGNEKYISRDGILFDKNITQLIKCPDGKEIMKIKNVLTRGIYKGLIAFYKGQIEPLQFYYTYIK